MPLPGSPSRSSRNADSARDPLQAAMQAAMQNHLSIKLEQGIARMLELHEESIDKQVLQQQILQNQLQSMLANQASLRTLLKSQHEQVMQGLASSSVNTTPFQPMLPQQTRVQAVDAKPKEQTWLQSGAAKPKDIVDLKPAETSNGEHMEPTQEKKKPALTRSATQGVVLDISKLPTTWITDPYELNSKGEAPRHPCLHRARQIVTSGWFDLFFTLVIFANLISMVVQLQWRSYHAAMLIGDRDDDNGWGQAEGFFETLELIYTIIFAVETVLRIAILRWEFLGVAANVFDTFIVVVTSVQMFVLSPVGLMKDTNFISVARLIRLVRVLRFLQIVRFAEACSELRILARALSSCMGSLVWSMLLLVILILAGAIILFQLSLVYVEDESNDEAMRRWSQYRFGSIALSMVALWECTFTGSWHRYTWRMIVDMKPYYALFWVPYIVCINFSVMRLIGALFLKEIMTTAAVDAEKVSLAKLKRQRAYADTIREIFKEADVSGDGKISAEEFEQMIYSHHVGACFEKLELEVSEVAVLFELLAQDGGEADYHEFLEGALKLKQPAQTIDVIELLHGSQKACVALQTVYDGICDLSTSLGVPIHREALSLDDADMKHLMVATRDPNAGGDPNAITHGQSEALFMDDGS